MYEFWYDYVKPKYAENANPCYMDTHCFIVLVKMIFIKMLQKKLKLDLTLQILNQTDHCLKGKMSNWINEK